MKDLCQLGLICCWIVEEFFCCNLGCSCELSLTNFWLNFEGIVDTAGGADGRM